MRRVLEPEVMEGASEAAAYDELDRKWATSFFRVSPSRRSRWESGKGASSMWGAARDASPFELPD
jgi:hypothetical protein